MRSKPALKGDNFKFPLVCENGTECILTDQILPRIIPEGCETLGWISKSHILTRGWLDVVNSATTPEKAQYTIRPVTVHLLSSLAAGRMQCCSANLRSAKSPIDVARRRRRRKKILAPMQHNKHIVSRTAEQEFSVFARLNGH